MISTVRSAILAMCMSSAAFAGDMDKYMHHVGDLMIDAPMIREVAAGQRVTAGYMTLTNMGDTDDVLVAASAAFSDRIELHEMKMDGDTMKMREVEAGIVIPAGQTVHLIPGGLHVMIFGPTDSVEPDAVVEMTLTFENAGEVTLPFTGATMKTLREMAKEVGGGMQMKHGTHKHADG